MRAKAMGVKDFIPVTLEIVLETKQEVESFHNIFNCSQILEPANIAGHPIRKSIERAMDNRMLTTSSWNEFYKGVEARFKKYNNRV